jgi:hypothetical protein
MKSIFCVPIRVFVITRTHARVFFSLLYSSPHPIMALRIPKAAAPQLFKEGYKVSILEMTDHNISNIYL